jgi:hypothetical protein
VDLDWHAHVTQRNATQEFGPASPMLAMGGILTKATTRTRVIGELPGLTGRAVRVESRSSGSCP